MSREVRNVTAEYDLGRRAADRDVMDTDVVNLPAIKKSAYAAGYARALMDVADGKVKAPEPDWRDP